MVPAGNVVVMICSGVVLLDEDDPVPDRATVCGLPDALSAIVNTPVFVPAAVGLKLMLMVQEVPAGCEMETPQVPVPAKAKAPLKVMLEKVSVAFPVFATVTNWAALVLPTVWEAKVNVFEDRLRTGAVVGGGEEDPVVEDAPVPDIATVCFPPEALSVIVSVPVLVPAAVGVKLMLMVQEVPAGCEMETPQVPTPAKAKLPLKVILEKVRVAFPVLATVTS